MELLLVLPAQRWCSTAIFFTSTGCSWRKCVRSAGYCATMTCEIFTTLNKDRPTWCHLFYYSTIYCSTCFECQYIHLQELATCCGFISCVVLLWFDVCWCYGVVRLGWCGILMQAEALVLITYIGDRVVCRFRWNCFGWFGELTESGGVWRMVFVTEELKHWILLIWVLQRIGINKYKKKNCESSCLLFIYKDSCVYFSNKHS